MAPLIALVVVTAVLLALGALGVRPLRNWSTALRGGLAAMFLLTGGAHFIGMRAELVAMVPPVLPAPELLVTVTGVLEIAGAVGLLLPRTARAAAACLTALLVVMFPANVYALLNGIGVGSDPFDAVLPRTILQVVFVAATLAVVLALRPARAETRQREGAASTPPYS